MCVGELKIFFNSKYTCSLILKCLISPFQKQLVITLIGVAEVHILWAQHQVHHSSEDYNLAVGLRQSVLQGWCGFVSVPLPSSL